MVDAPSPRSGPSTTSRVMSAAQSRGIADLPASVGAATMNADMHRGIEALVRGVVLSSMGLLGGCTLPPDVVAKTRAKYVEAYERITGATFVS